MAGTLYVSNPKRGRARVRRNPTEITFKDATSPAARALIRADVIASRYDELAQRQVAKLAKMEEAGKAKVEALRRNVAVAEGIENERAAAALNRRVAAEDAAALRELGITSGKSRKSRKRRSGGSVAKRKISASQQAKMQAGKRRKAGRMSSTTSKRVRRVRKGGISAKRWGKARSATSSIRGAARKLSVAKRAPRGKRRKAVAQAGRSIARSSRNLIKNPLVISNPMSGIPVLGTAISLVGPAFFGGVGIELSGQVYKYAGQYVPESIAPYMDKAKFTIGGLVIAGVVQLLPFLSPPLKHSLGLAFASAGGGVDWYRYRSSEQAYGDLALGDLAYSDGGNWAVEYGGDDDYADEEDAMGDLQLADTAGDEEYSGLDFGNEEGEAMAESFGAYHRKFPHRRGSWHWLAKEFGPEEAKRLANMPPEERVRVIRECKRLVANRKMKQLVQNDEIQQHASMAEHEYEEPGYTT